MPVNSKHPVYKQYIDQWTRCRHVVQGEDAVKQEGERYLPRLGGQSSSDYNAYKARASFFPATKRTVLGLCGMATRKPPVLKVDTQVKKLLNEIGSDNEHIDLFVSNIVQELLTLGRVGVLVDMPTEGDSMTPYVTAYIAESIINWKYYRDRFGRQVPELIVLSEEYVEPDKGDMYEDVTLPALRVLYLDTSESNGERQYVQELYVLRKDEQGKQDWKLIETYMPTRVGGKTLDFIPFTIINVGELGERVGDSPINDLATMNISHYCNSADLEHGLHFTALPTAYVTGITSTEKKADFKIGSTVAWLFEEPTAKVGFLEFNGMGLSAISSSMSEKEKRMAVLGARLLEEQKMGVEAAGTVQLRHAGEKSVLSRIVEAVGYGLKDMLDNFSIMLNIEPNDITVEMNNDFDTVTIPADMAKVLMEMLQNNHITYHTFYFQMKKGELYPDGWTEEDELTLLSQQQDDSLMRQMQIRKDMLQNDPQPTQPTQTEESIT